MRIVHFGTASDVPVLYRFGGAMQRRIFELSKRQVQRGHEVTIYSYGPSSETLHVEGVTVRYLKCMTGHPLRQLEFQTRVMVDLRARTEPIDVLHCHSQPESAVLAKGLARVTALSFDFFKFRRGHATPLGHIYKKLLQQFDLLLPVSEYCRDEAARYWGISASDMDIVHNGVNLEQFHPDAAAGQRERDNAHVAKPFVVAYVGRVCRQKGTHLLIDAFRKLNAAGRASAVQLVIAGPIGQFGRDADPDNWATQIADVGGIYLGPVEEERLSAVYNMADFTVMPTLEDEMFGMAAVEAQACGIPTLASRQGGLPETVPPSCGELFPVGDSDALAQSIVRLTTDTVRLQKLRDAARANAHRFSWDTIVDRLDGLFASALESPGCSGQRQCA